ncbi:dystrophin [Elysia marginata]|uniref:Dystrophin n=1 Tax=Elysia marginata TaxID=1093978 RepID=A0AAV4ER75_9GAST|nr:dystrophin [Elysia marginata]
MDRKGQTDLCLCEEAAETAEHALQDYQNYRKLRQAILAAPQTCRPDSWETLKKLEKTNSSIHLKKKGGVSIFEVNTENKKNKLQTVLMELQQGQLDELGSWLTTMEQRIEKQQNIGADLDAIKAQVEEHKAIQKSLEEQQKKVDSLQNMVVVVDDTNTESACAAMEHQLEALGKRWAQICRWTEEQWILLQELLMRWQQFADEQAKFSDWLTEKEALLASMRSADLSTAEEVINQVRHLKVRNLTDQ